MLLLLEYQLVPDPFPLLSFFLFFRELAKGLGEKGVIVFEDVKHVIMKSE